ncbi:hypothetical protein K501DRAFT_330923 [Backusella circina FSU 941]|nr:hypothetical protein K501DRAFT_330923 [Backusella circina FSU 941]
MTHHTTHTVTVVAQPSRENKYASNPNLIPFLMSQHYAMQNNELETKQQLLLQQQQQQQQQKKYHHFQEQQKSYVSALVNVTVQIITSIWPNSNSRSVPQQQRSPLERPGQQGNNNNRPIANLSTFLHHILKHSRTTHSTLQLAIFYLFRIRTVVQERRAQDAYISCGRRMFLAALITAHKFLQDKTYKNTAWSKVSGLGVLEITRAERTMLQLLDYNLYVKKDIYDQWIGMLQSHIKMPIVASECHDTPSSQSRRIQTAQQSLPSPPAEHMSPQKRKHSFLDELEDELVRKKHCIL